MSHNFSAFTSNSTNIPGEVPEEIPSTYFINLGRVIGWLPVPVVTCVCGYLCSKGVLISGSLHELCINHQNHETKAPWKKRQIKIETEVLSLFSK